MNPISFKLGIEDALNFRRKVKENKKPVYKMSQDNFVWDETSVLEFVGYLCGRGMQITQLGNEIALFKESKLEKTKRDWVVVEFTAFDGRKYHNPKGVESHICEKDTITSVKRLSDGEVFSIGDEVRFIAGKCNYDSFKIDNFLVRHFDGKLLARSEGGLTNEFISDIGKVVKPKPLFVTEDGVEIFDGEMIVLYVSDYKIRDRKAKNMVGLQNKKFVHRSKAEEYILINKPLLSVNDVRGLATTGAMAKDYELRIAVRDNDLLRLAKEKLSK